MARIAVTGASGHVGANLVNMLLSRGDSVTWLQHEHDMPLPEAAVPVPGDVRDPNAINTLVRDADVVFHLAARISLTRSDHNEVRAINVQGTRNVIAACKQSKVRRLVHFSSVHALSPLPEGEATTEARPLVDSSADLIRQAATYDLSKAESEREVLNAATDGLDAVVVSPCAVVGPFDRQPSYVGSMLLDSYHGRLPALVQGGFNWVDARDVVAGALAASERGKSGERYILGGQWAPIRTLAQMFCALGGRSVPRLTVPIWVARMGAPWARIAATIQNQPLRLTAASLDTLQHHRNIQIDKAKRDLGYQPRPLNETVQAAYEWYRDNGRLA